MSRNSNISSTQENYLRRMKHQQYRIKIIQILIFFVFLGLWETAVQLSWIDGFIFSSPLRLWNCLVEMLASGELLRHLGVTVGETLISFALIMVIGIAVAILLWWSESLAKGAGYWNRYIGIQRRREYRRHEGEG